MIPDDGAPKTRLPVIHWLSGMGTGIWCRGEERKETPISQGGQLWILDVNGV